MPNRCFKIVILALLLVASAKAQVPEFQLSAEEKKNVTVLNLKRQKLKSLPKEVFDFQNLEVLILQKNKLTSLPDSLWQQLPRLHYIDVSQNKLLGLPKSWSDLPIDTLIANRNYISEIPESYVQISSLTYLDVWSNELAGLPAGFARHPNLRVVDMRNISMNKRHQTDLLDAFPKIEILLSAPCNCGD